MYSNVFCLTLLLLERQNSMFNIHSPLPAEFQQCLCENSWKTMEKQEKDKCQTKPERGYEGRYFKRFGRWRLDARYLVDISS